MNNKNKLLDTLERIAIALENIEQAVTKLHDYEKHSVANAINQALSSAIHDTDEEVRQ